MTRSVADLMARELVTFTPETNILEAVHVLLERCYSGAPVVSTSGELVGVLSKKDCLRIVISSRYHDDRGGSVAEYMSTPVETLDAELDLVSAAQHFIESRYRRFPVVRSGVLVGQVSRADILRAITEDRPGSCG